VIASDLVDAVRREAETDATLEERAQRIAELIRTGTGRRWAGIYRVTDERVTNLAWSGPDAPAYPSFPRAQGLTGAAIESARTIVSNDVASDPRYLTNQESTGSELIVPVFVDGTVVGTLDVEDEATDAFSDEDEALFETLAAAITHLYI
jgi:L-methionine (R)-S-oxide reductase